MPKHGKSHKGVRKRMKLTGTGKVTRSRANTGHLQSGKSSVRRRRLRKSATVSKGQLKTYARLITG